MPFQRLLDELAARVEGFQGALMLDAEGEVAVESGARDDRHRLIGAYQGIALATAKRTNQRYEAGSIRYITCQYEAARLVLRPLKDGYYLIVSLAPEAPLAPCLRHSAALQTRFNQEL
jgi:predicted regulator of Ras-like GTPase activity (Roadblock/LC7/MglB family)